MAQRGKYCYTAPGPRATIYENPTVVLLVSVTSAFKLEKMTHPTIPPCLLFKEYKSENVCFLIRLAQVRLGILVCLLRLQGLSLFTTMS